MEPLKLSDQLMTIADEPENYDNPTRTVWVIGVDRLGAVFIIEPPNIHHSFFECDTAEEIGIMFESDWTPGVYEIKCEIIYSTCTETGVCDGVTFWKTEHRQLWAMPINVDDSL